MTPGHPHHATALPPASGLSLRVYTPSGPPAQTDLPTTARQVRRGRWRRVLVGLLALWLFLSAIAVMKDGAAPLGELLRGSFLIDSILSTLGFGWLGAMLIMSGSPVAVAALTMQAGDAISAVQSLSMLTGSRLGASFVVLTVSFLYATRSRAAREQRRASVSIGIYCLLLTALVYLPALAITIPIYNAGLVSGIQLSAPPAVLDVVDLVIGPVVALVTAIVPDAPGLLFLAGLLLLLVSVRLVDLALPDADDTAHLEEHSDWRSRKWRMFAVGSLVALVTMSVSVALTVLVPAVAKGYFRRRQVMPYILGANITTLGDTLLVALLLKHPPAVQVVLLELAAITVITVALLALAYRPLQEQVTRATDWILDTRPRLVGFVAMLFATPIVLILLP
jgi:solute carrier family 34 (sodium-dependent phosphate cotransporter)